MKHHVAGHITDGGVRVQGSVIKEAKGIEVRVFGRLGLVGIQRVKGNKYGGFNCNGIVEQRIGDLLDKVEIFRGKAERRVIIFVKLDAGTKDRAVPGIRGILGVVRRKVLKFMQGFCNVVRHGDISGAAILIPGDGESAEEVGVPID